MTKTPMTETRSLGMIASFQGERGTLLRVTYSIHLQGGAASGIRAGICTAAGVCWKGIDRHLGFY